MASVIEYKPGYFAVQFSAGKARPIIYLGKIARRAAQNVAGHVESLRSAIAAGQPPAAITAVWLKDIDAKLHAKLAKAKLVQPREEESALALEKFLDKYIRGRTDLKERTKLNLIQVRNGLVEHLGAARDIRAITRGDMADWHRWLKGRGLARATIAMHVKKARQFFEDALSRKFIAENPVRGIKAGGMSNPDRFHYVPLAVIAKVIDACPGIEWKLIFGLARFGALRTPSETKALRWRDIDWQKSRMTVRASKTAHHHGGGVRQVPIGPLLKPLLQEAYDRLEEGGSEYVIVEARTVNPGTMGAKIIERAGVAAWPKLFQNLRSSCETDWTASFPLHVACAWAGNSELVAKKHYLQTTDEHFENAANGAAPNAASGAATDEKTPATVRNHVAGVYLLPPRGSKLRSISPRYSGFGRKVLRGALRRLRQASPYLYQQSIKSLREKGTMS